MVCIYAGLSLFLRGLTACWCPQYVSQARSTLFCPPSVSTRVQLSFLHQSTRSSVHLLSGLPLLSFSFVLRRTSFSGLSSLIHHIWPRKFNFLWTSSGWIILWTILMFVSILFVITLCWCLWAMQAQQYISIVFSALYQTLMSGCFDAVGWETGRAQEHTLIKAGHPLC